MDKKTIFTFINIFVTMLLFLVVIFSFSTTTALADNKTPMEGLNESAKEGYGSDPDKAGSGLIKNLPNAIGKVLGAVLQFIGAFFLILTIYGGFTWMFARGNDQDVQKAKDIIEAALIGLIIVLSAYAITTFIGGSLTGK